MLGRRSYKGRILSPSATVNTIVGWSTFQSGTTMRPLSSVLVAFAIFLLKLVLVEAHPIDTDASDKSKRGRRHRDHRPPLPFDPQLRFFITDWQHMLVLAAVSSTQSCNKYTDASFTSSLRPSAGSRSAVAPTAPLPPTMAQTV